jgi:hypothetical protein
MAKQRQRSILFVKKIKRKSFGYYTGTSTKRKPAWEGGDHIKISMRRKRKVAIKIRETARYFIPRRKSKQQKGSSNSDPLMHDAAIHQYLLSLYPRIWVKPRRVSKSNGGRLTEARRR